MTWENYFLGDPDKIISEALSDESYCLSISLKSDINNKFKLSISNGSLHAYKSKEGLTLDGLKDLINKKNNINFYNRVICLLLRNIKLEWIVKALTQELRKTADPHDLLRVLPIRTIDMFMTQGYVKDRINFNIVESLVLAKKPRKLFIKEILKCNKPGLTVKKAVRLYAFLQKNFYPLKGNKSFIADMEYVVKLNKKDMPKFRNEKIVMITQNVTETKLVGDFTYYELDAIKSFQKSEITEKYFNSEKFGDYGQRKKLELKVTKTYQEIGQSIDNQSLESLRNYKERKGGKPKQLTKLETIKEKEDLAINSVKTLCHHIKNSGLIKVRTKNLKLREFSLNRLIRNKNLKKGDEKVLKLKESIERDKSNIWETPLCTKSVICTCLWYFLMPLKNYISEECHNKAIEIFKNELHINVLNIPTSTKSFKANNAIKYKYSLLNPNKDEVVDSRLIVGNKPHYFDIFDTGKKKLSAKDIEDVNTEMEEAFGISDILIQIDSSSDEDNGNSGGFFNMNDDNDY